ncbi:hypothetical protein ACWEHA_31560 [Amycolatopsis nivea]
MTRPDIVTYDGLPTGAHALRIRKPAVAHQKVRAFLDACTEPAGASVLIFQIWAGGLDERWRELAADLLGGPSRTDRTHREWRVREDSVPAILAALDGAEPEDVTRYGRSVACLVLNSRVRLVDPDSREPYVSEEDTGRFAVDGYGRILGASGVRSTIGSAASSLSLWLSFPGDDRLGAAAAQVQEHAPVRLSAKHWRRWTPGRDGAGYRSGKIPSPVGSA